MGKHFVGLDNGKGLAILGVLFSHSFMGGLASWNTKVLFDLVSKSPIVLVIIIFLPVALFSLMGALFSFITSICVTLSILSILKKGYANVWKYITMKIVFALLLKALEDFWLALLDTNYFEKGKFTFPVVEFRYWAHTLDDVGFFSWFVPLIVVCVASIPWFKHYYTQVAVLTIVGIILTQINGSFLELFAMMGEFFKKKELYFLYYLCSKVDNGAFAVGQYFGMALIGGATGVLFYNTDNMRTYMAYLIILGVISLGLGIPQFVTVENAIFKVFDWIKPTGFLHIMIYLQFCFVIVCVYIWDNPKKSLIKRYRSNKRTIFIRRACATSLTAYVIETRWNKMVYIIFKAIFGPGVSETNKDICNWSWYVAVLYMISSVLLWIGVNYLWEKVHFRYCLENQLSTMMSWVFNVPYSKSDFNRVIYGPVEDVTKEIEMKKGEEQMVTIEVTPQPHDDSLSPDVDTPKEA